MRLILGVTGASGALAAKVFVQRSPFDVSLVASVWGRDVYERECGSFEELASSAVEVFEHNDLAAPIASGSVPNRGMVILPCSVNTLAHIAHGMSDNLITRAAHCQLKEGRPLILCVRETPWSLIDIQNAQQVAAAGGVIMPVSLPFYMASGGVPSLHASVGAYVDRILAMVGAPAFENWETVS